MEKKILVFILLLIGNGIVNAVEYSFAPSYNEHFVVEDYGSEIVGSAERPFSNWREVLEDAARMNPVIVFGQNINHRYDPNWPSYVDPDYWEEFLNNYPEYQDEVEEYFEQNPTAPNNPFIPIIPIDSNGGGMLILLIGGIAYLIYKFKFKKNEDFKN